VAGTAGRAQTESVHRVCRRVSASVRILRHRRRRRRRCVVLVVSSRRFVRRCRPRRSILDGRSVVRYGTIAYVPKTASGNREQLRFIRSLPSSSHDCIFNRRRILVDTPRTSGNRVFSSQSKTTSTTTGSPSAFSLRVAGANPPPTNRRTLHSSTA